MSAPRPRGGAPLPPSWTATDRDYLWIPTRLLDTLYDSPLAIGLYALIARRWLADGGPDGVPLSDADVARYDPQLSSRGALVRAVARLEAAGWVVTVRARGTKTRYTPAWGRGRTGVRPWSTAMPSLGRSRVQTLRVARRLLDDYLGRLIPHPKAPAQIERYQAAPPISLKDIGVYILRQRGRDTIPAPALAQARLCTEDTPLVVPPTRETLARAELSVQGMRRVGLLSAGPQPPPGAPDRRPSVFFVGVGMIGHMIGHMIHQAPGCDGPSGPSEGAKPRLAADQENRTGMQGIPGMQNPPTPTGDTGEGGGVSRGSIQDDQQTATVSATTSPQSTHRARRPRRESNVMSNQDTPSAERLRALGVRPAQVRELAAVALETIQAAIADGQSRPSVRDQAAWVVSLLRDVRDHGWDLSMRTRGAPPSNAGPTLAQLQATIARARASGLWTTEADAPPPGSEGPGAPPISAETTTVLARARASGFFGAREDDPGCPPEVPAAGATPVERSAPPLVLPPAPGRVPGPRLAPPAPADAGRPDWIAPAAWRALPVLLRGVLRGSRRQDQTITAADPWSQAQLARFPHAVAGLLAAAGSAPGAIGAAGPARDRGGSAGLCYNGDRDDPDAGRSS